jgi:hypothetical protein
MCIFVTTKDKGMEANVLINTKSNFRNLNGTTQPVVEIKGERVTCLVNTEDHPNGVKIDFTLKEVTFV